MAAVQNTKSVCCCIHSKNRHKIFPQPGVYEGYKIVEIRSNRFIRIHHTLPNGRLSSADGLREVRPYDHKKSTDSLTPTVSQISSQNESSTTLDPGQKKRVTTASSVQLAMNIPVRPFSSEKHKEIRNNTEIVNTTNMMNHRNERNCKNSSEQQNTSPSLKVRTSLISASSTVIFFIHGVGGSSDVWQAQIKHFSALGYEVVAPDFIGHGFSSAPRDPSMYKFNEIMEDIFVIFDNYSKNKNIVVGHSYGSSFATILARTRHRKVLRLVLISGGGPTPLAPQPGVFSLPECMLCCCRPILYRGFKRSAFHDKSDNLQEHAFDVPMYVLKYTMNGQNWADGNVEYHNAITVPTLLIYGGNDKLVDLEEEEDMNKTIYGSHLEIIPNASHMVILEKPQEVNTLIQNFIMNSIADTSPSSHTCYKRSKSNVSEKSVKSIPDGLIYQSFS